MTAMHEIAIFGGGCFWCTEAVFRRLKGVTAVTPGYAGGTTERPSYEQVSSGTTNHAEVVRVEFDPAAISYDDLLTVFFATHDPTTLNRQGADVGTQYRSIIFYADEKQKTSVERFIAELNADGPNVVTEVVPLEVFYEAESYHKNYYENNKEKQYCELVINPKLEKLEKRFERLLKNHGEKS